MRTIPSPPASEARLTGRRTFALFAVFFGIIASADAILVTSAVRTWSGLEEPSPYRASQRYNAALHAARAQDDRGWALESAVRREGRTGVALSVTLRDRDGTALDARTVQARLERPTDKRADLSVALAGAGAGTYAGRVGAVAGGQWDLVVEVHEDGAVAFRRKARVVLN
ncbi:MAG: FixH family protein [Methylobacterium sp.]|uniref:FixH family protein n=1 Tax=Methylobacterium sp. TaxID=409 RepID=UPI00258CC9EB|nr:FixH family protein [Methylobacterium sp.]MBY0296110.1 FixH family protein [Methylobacterium sp.]